MPVDLVKSDVAAGATNTLRPLTHSLDLSKEGLAMDATRTCSECGARAIARGLCNPHYKAAKRRGVLPPKLNPEAERRRKFWAKVNKSETCWLWTGFITRQGYGQFGHGVRGVTMRAHKLAWEWENGPVPDGLVLDHLCRNRACVRPEHMEPVTPRENALRGIGPTAINSRKSRCKCGLRLNERRRCTRCDRRKNYPRLEREKRERDALRCGAVNTRKPGTCKHPVAKGNSCPYHGRTWDEIRVLYTPEVDR